MAVTHNYLEYVLEQLASLGDVTSRRMFGAVGLYQGDRFFALIDNDVVYFKVNDSNRGDYEARNMSRFRPFADKPELSMSYYEVPADAIEDSEELVRWARKSIAIASSKAPGKSRKRAVTRKGAKK
jgi:DNA transformation protein